MLKLTGSARGGGEKGHAEGPGSVGLSTNADAHRHDREKGGRADGVDTLTSANPHDKGKSNN